MTVVVSEEGGTTKARVWGVLCDDEAVDGFDTSTAGPIAPWGELT